MIAIVSWNLQSWTGCYGCDSELRSESQPWLQPWSKPPFQNVSEAANRNHNPESQPEGPKIRKPWFFLWLRSGFQLQFCNPETFWNGGYEQVATDSQPWNGGDDQVLIRVATRVADRNPESQPETPRFRVFGEFATLGVFLQLWFRFQSKPPKVFPVTKFFQTKYEHILKRALTWPPSLPPALH